MFPKEAQAIADEILGGGKYAPGYVRTYWEGCTHGFAVRGDLVRVPRSDSSWGGDTDQRGCLRSRIPRSRLARRVSLRQR